MPSRSRDSSRRWRSLGQPEPRSLVETRLQLHWAVQPVSAFGASFVEARPDDSHLSLAWDDELGALVSRSAAGYAAALCLSDLTLLWIEKREGPRDRLALEGRTLQDAMAWLEAQAARSLRAGPVRPLAVAGWDLPEHPVASGGSFARGDGEALSELGRWYGNADLVLQGLAGRLPDASQVRCWAHHFDIATLIRIDGDAQSENARSVGVGMSPGDPSYAEPYFYVNPWPRPQTDEVPALAGGGEWHTKGWFGAVLLGSRLTEETSAETQRRGLEAFIDSALASARRLLGA